MEIIKYIKNTTNLFFGKFDDGYKYLEENTTFLPVFMFGILLSVLTMFINISYLIKVDLGFMSIYNTIGNIFYLIIPIIGLIQYTILYFGLFGLLHLFLKLFKGTGKYLDTIKFIIGASTVTLLVSLIFVSIPPKIVQANIIINSIIFLIILGTIIWNIYVNIIILSKVHNISKAKVIYAISLVFGILIVLLLSYILYLVNSQVVTV